MVRRKNSSLLSGIGLPAAAPTWRPMTLRQAVETALKQNPDIALSRLEEESARQAVRVAKDPFTPRLTVAAAWRTATVSPMSIEGSAPSIVQARATQDLFNRRRASRWPRRKRTRAGPPLASRAKRDEVAYRTASLYLDAERAARIGALAPQGRPKAWRRLWDRPGAGAGRPRPAAATREAGGPGMWRRAPDRRGLGADQATAETALGGGHRPLRDERCGGRWRRSARTGLAAIRGAGHPGRPSNPTRNCGARNRRSFRKGWKCAARMPPVAQDGPWWLSTACSPNSTTTPTSSKIPAQQLCNWASHFKSRYSGRSGRGAQIRAGPDRDFPLADRAWAIRATAWLSDLAAGLPAM